MNNVELIVEALRRFTETHPRPLHVNQLQAAEMLGISRQTVSRLVKVGEIKMNRLGQIPISEIDAALRARNES